MANSNNPLQTDHFNFNENNYFGNLIPETNFQGEPTANINDGYNNSLPTMNDNSMFYGSAVSHHQQQMAGSNSSIQLIPPSYGSRYIGHANSGEEQNPPMSMSTNNISLNVMATNLPPQSNSGIFRFEIPGFRIIVIPIENINVQEEQSYLNNSSPNINTNNPQSQFQQAFHNLM
ncbi:5733_t:CDS:1 [Funneliformis geosporum]|uniref:2030_t:CDS:1 n=1 Tax=Funneliformis geosporum TaxID=1117311 RepID=A0A9W4SVV4_9GLOM|nr:5733_t:CDS:1 [Funneliformis geosporum]CAI2182757.1 2030_t:CDS:1 [Funneliformis geosporum]